MLVEVKSPSGLRISLDTESIFGVGEDRSHTTLLTDAGVIPVHGTYEEWVQWYTENVEVVMPQKRPKSK